MAFDQATRERRCISECTCAMQAVSWPPTYLATCIYNAASFCSRPYREIFFGGGDTICQRASQERDASLHERRVLSQKNDSAMGDRKFCEQSLRALPCTGDDEQSAAALATESTCFTWACTCLRCMRSKFRIASASPCSALPQLAKAGLASVLSQSRLRIAELCVRRES